MVYQDPPWVFKGRAWYQLQLVKSRDARKYIPEDFKLVELFGYTLGGFYLARYSDSPAGAFDELVALAGLVWNPPTSCAWAARVYVSSKEARDHGLHHVGLPSRLAQFEQTKADSDKERFRGDSGSRLIPNPLGSVAAITSGILSSAAALLPTFTPAADQLPSSFWHSCADTRPALATSPSLPCSVQVHNTEHHGWFGGGRGLSLPVSSFHFPHSTPTEAIRWGSLSLPFSLPAWGPRLTLRLPSFSGGTVDFPDLLQYTCKLDTNVLVKRPVAVTIDEKALQKHEDNLEMIGSIMTGTPVVALLFDDMVMYVDAPRKWGGY